MVPFQPVELIKARELRTKVHQHLETRIATLTQMRDRIEKTKLKKERQRLDKRNILRMKLRMERDVLEAQRVSSAAVTIQRHVRGHLTRRVQREKARAEEDAHIDMEYCQGVVDDCYDHIQRLKLAALYEPEVAKIGLIQQVYRQQAARPPRADRIRSFRAQKFALMLAEILEGYTPQALAFQQLTTLRDKGRDMRERARKRAVKREWLVARAAQREKVAVLKLNFVSGLLNRFYFAFLEEFRLDRGGTAKHALRGVSMSLQERQMASAIVSGTTAGFGRGGKGSARPTAETNSRTKGTSPVPPGLGGQALDPDFLLQLQCNLRGRDRKPLSLTALTALPVPIAEYKLL